MSKQRFLQRSKRRFSSVWRSITRPVRRAVRLVKRRLNRRQSKSGVAGKVLVILSFPLTLLRAVWHQVRRQLRKMVQRRKLRFAVQGSVAVAVASIAIVTIAAQLSVSDEVVLRDYRIAADSALADEDYPSAVVFYKRILQISSGNSEAKYLLATALEAEGSTVRAESMIHELAPDNSQGYAMAHLWRARRELESERDMSDQMRAAKRHLTFAVEADPLLHDAHNLLSRVLIQEQQYAAAIPHLEVAAEYQPLLLMSLANLYQVVGRENDAVAISKQAGRFFRRKPQRLKATSPLG